MRDDPSRDDYLSRPLKSVDREKVISEVGGFLALVPLETLRDDISLRRVQHGVLTLSKLADRGRQLPPLRSTPPEHHAKIEVATLALLDVERRLAESSAHS